MNALQAFDFGEATLDLIMFLYHWNLGGKKTPNVYFNRRNTVKCLFFWSKQYYLATQQKQISARAASLEVGPSELFSKTALVAKLPKKNQHLFFPPRSMRSNSSCSIVQGRFIWKTKSSCTLKNLLQIYKYSDWYLTKTRLQIVTDSQAKQHDKTPFPFHAAPPNCSAVQNTEWENGSSNLCKFAGQSQTYFPGIFF